MWNFSGSVNHVYPNMIQWLMNDGEVVGVRGTRTKELSPVAIDITSPDKRLVTSYGRPINVAFAMAEVLWILLGRRDVEMLEFYNSTIKQWSDDGVHMNAPYGYRLRQIYGYDQIRDAILALRDNRGSRRATMVIWHPNDRNFYIDPELPTIVTPNITKDRACLAGDTLVWSPEGNLSIAEVADRFATGSVSKWPVYTVNTKTLEAGLVWATDVWCSGVQKTIRVTFDDGSNIRLTPDHRLYRKFRKRLPGMTKRVTGTVAEECEASTLVPGDRVLAINMHNDRGYSWFKRSIKGNTAYRNRQGVHKVYAELITGNPIPTGHDVHHINGDSADNRAANLVILEHGEHASLNMFGDQNPHRRMTPEQKASRARKHSDAMKRAWDRGAYADRGNHIVVSVEECEAEPVYDLTVPETHTAVIGTGVVAHNCNVMAHLMIRGDELTWLQVVRSNDAILGVPYNFIQWLSIHEYIARELGVFPGRFTYIADSMHMYIDGSYYDSLSTTGIREFDLHEHYPKPLPMVGYELDVLEKLEQHIRNGEESKVPLRPVSSFWDAALCIWAAHAAYRDHKDELACERLMMNPNVYSIAQLKFYFQNRWWKMGWSYDHGPAEVTEWVTS